MRHLLVFAVLIGALSGSRAVAQSTRDFSTLRYRPAVGVGNYLAVEGASVGPPRQLSYGLAFDYSADTLTVDDPCQGLQRIAPVSRCSAGETHVVEQTTLAHVLVAIPLPGRTQLSLDLPLGATDAEPVFYEVGNVGSANPRREVRLRDGFVVGDARLLSKTHLYGQVDDELQVAAAAFTTLPTGMLTSNKTCREPESCSFVGEFGVQVGAFGIVEYAPTARLRIAGNLGALYRPKRDFLGTEVSSELSFGGAVAYQVAPHLSAKAELAGALALAGDHDVPLEARGGISYGRDLVFTIGGGAGIVGDVGSPTFRIFAGLQWTPVYRDADHDQIEDGDDRCPHQAEDRDGFEDDDGCPELDNDGDGVPDARDECDDAREDMDGFQDEDGCPELDNDGDGVLDGYDSCEGEKEDIDGDHDDDGCPDLDYDGDGVADTEDACPEEPESRDGNADEDGCPE